MEVENETSPGLDDDLRQRLLKERDAENEALERELEAESVKLDEEIEQEIRGTSQIMLFIYNALMVYQRYRQKN